jgi:protein-tyrosine phosphatase
VETVAGRVNGQGFVDIHCHLLPGLDDGPADEAESLEMARILASAGFSEVYCTPHLIRGAYDNPPERVRDAVAALQKTLDRAQVPLKLHPGTEYYLDEYLPLYLNDPLTIGGSFLLVESPSRVDPAFLLDSIYQVVRKGLTPILAHPERCAVLDPDKETVKRLGEMGCLFQQNIGSFAGIYGEHVRLRALAYLKNGLCGRAATDAHHSVHLGQWIAKGMAMIDKKVGTEMKKDLLSTSGMSLPA